MPHAANHPPHSAGTDPQRHATYRKGLAAIHAAVLLFGLPGVLGKVVTASPLIIVLARSSIAAILLGLLLLVRLHRQPETGMRHWFALVISGVILAAHWLAFFQSVQVSTVAIGLLTFSTFPVFVTLLEPCFFPERLRQRDLVLALAVIAGTALVVPEYDFHGRMMQGAAWGVLSGFTFALLALANRRFVRSWSPLAIGAGQNAVAALVILPFMAGASWTLSQHDLFWLAILGVFCTALAHVLFIRGLAAVRAQTASIITALEPVYGILLAALWLNEIPSGRMAAGGVVILVATILAGRKNIRS